MQTAESKAACRASGPPGRILRLKQGYNPNSSSLGSIVFALPVTLIGLSALFGFAASLLTSAAMGRRSSPDTAQGTGDAGDRPDGEIA